jgi:hypothetical protein
MFGRASGGMVSFTQAGGNGRRGEERGPTRGKMILKRGKISNENDEGA